MTDLAEPLTREVSPKEAVNCGSSATCSTDVASSEPSLRDDSDSDDDAPICYRCRHVCEGSWFLSDDRVFCSKDCRSGGQRQRPVPVKPQSAPAPPVVWTDPRSGALSASAIQLNDLLASAGLAPA
jgi:hypothetical protein